MLADSCRFFFDGGASVVVGEVDVFSGQLPEGLRVGLLQGGQILAVHAIRGGVHVPWGVAVDSVSKAMRCGRFDLRRISSRWTCAVISGTAFGLFHFINLFGALYSPLYVAIQVRPRFGVELGRWRLGLRLGYSTVVRFCWARVSGSLLFSTS